MEVEHSFQEAVQMKKLQAVAHTQERLLLALQLLVKQFHWLSVIITWRHIAIGAWRGRASVVSSASTFPSCR